MFKKLFLVFICAISLYAAKGPSLVEVDTIVKGEVNPLQEFIGTVNFENKSTIAAQNSGLVERINFSIGDKVKKAQVLVKIDSDILDAQIKSAQANLQSAQSTRKNAQKDFERYKKLLETNAITQKEFDDIKLKFNTSSTNKESLKARLNELKIQKAKKSIKAPYSAIVTKKNVNLGEWVNAGTSLLELVDTKNLEITFNVPSNIYKGLDKNLVYDIKVGNDTFKAKLIGAIPSGDNLTRTFPVKFKAINKDNFVFDGQEAKISLSKDSKKIALIVPRDAVIKRFGQKVVFIVSEKNTAMMIPVRIVGFLGKKLAIEGKGLQEGMKVVDKGNERIFPNSPVKIINK